MVNRNICAMQYREKERFKTKILYFWTTENKVFGCYTKMQTQDKSPSSDKVCVFNNKNKKLLYICDYFLYNNQVCKI